MKTITIIKKTLLYETLISEQELPFDYSLAQEVTEEVEESTREDVTDQDYQNNILAILNGENGEYFFRQYSCYATIIIKGNNK